MCYCSAQSFAAGFFEESNPSVGYSYKFLVYGSTFTCLQVISIRSIEEKDDVFLRYDELPCPAYDQKVTFNEVAIAHLCYIVTNPPSPTPLSQTLESWIESFFNTSAFQKLMLNVQRYFNPGMTLHIYLTAVFS